MSRIVIVILIYRHKTVDLNHSLHDELCLEFQLRIQIVKTRLGWGWSYCKPIYGLGRSGEEAVGQWKEVRSIATAPPVTASGYCIYLPNEKEGSDLLLNSLEGLHE
jgi:hypothetical protein